LLTEHRNALISAAVTGKIDARRLTDCRAPRDLFNALMLEGSMLGAWPDRGDA
jgi:hypothetical protein